MELSRPVFKNPLLAWRTDLFKMYKYTRFPCCHFYINTLNTTSFHLFMSSSFLILKVTRSICTSCRTEAKENIQQNSVMDKLEVACKIVKKMKRQEN